MRKIISRLLCTAVTACILTGITAPSARAGASLESAIQVADQVPGDDVKEDTKYDKYIAFGADLKPGEKTSVLNIFGLTEAGLADYKTIEITNKDEHDYLGDYLDKSVIGTRALSSVMVVKTEEGSGILVSTNNVNYCTSGMYCNALITAGLSDAQVTVAAPFNISGTSALVGAMKAYSVMTGQDISESTMDTATDELVTTAEVAESIGDNDKVVQLVAAAKQKIFEEELSSMDDIRDAVEASAEALKINIKEEDVEKLSAMLKKVSEVDIDVDAIKEQASEIYTNLRMQELILAKLIQKGLQKRPVTFLQIYLMQ